MLLNATEKLNLSNYKHVDCTQENIRVQCSREYTKMFILGRPVFIAYVTAGFPTVNDTVNVMLSLQEGGADIIELGIC